MIIIMIWEQCGSFPPQEVGWIIQVSIAGRLPKLTLAIISCLSIYPKIMGAEGPNPSPFCTWGIEGGLRFMAWTHLLPWLARR